MSLTSNGGETLDGFGYHHQEKKMAISRAMDAERCRPDYQGMAATLKEKIKN